MTFNEAKGELKSLVGKRYHSLSYELTEFVSGRLEAECSLYVDPRISVRGSTWQEAFIKMKNALGGESQVDSSEAPEEEISG